MLATLIFWQIEISTGASLAPEQLYMGVVVNSGQGHRMTPSSLRDPSAVLSPVLSNDSLRITTDQPAPSLYLTFLTAFRFDQAYLLHLAYNVHTFSKPF
jgi:hypothetical protein